MLMHALISRSEFYPRHRLRRNLEASRGQMCLSGSEGGVDFRIAVHGRDLELHAKLIRKELRQLIFGALGNAVRTAIERKRAGARHHPQLAQCLDLDDQAGNWRVAAQRNESANRYR